MSYAGKLCKSEINGPKLHLRSKSMFPGFQGTSCLLSGRLYKISGHNHQPGRIWIYNPSNHWFMNVIYRYQCSFLEKGILFKIYFWQQNLIYKAYIKQLNTFLNPAHFKLEDKNTLICLLLQNFYIANLDLKNAYSIVPILSSRRQYLRFFFQKLLYVPL